MCERFVHALLLRVCFHISGPCCLSRFRTPQWQVVSTSLNAVGTNDNERISAPRGPTKTNQTKLRNTRKAVYKSMKNNDVQWHNRNFIENGSGLSRKTRLKPESVMGLLKKIDQETKFLEIKSMLPVSGIDGTLKNIYRSETLRGQMKLKTGTLNGVRCLAGFITSKTGKKYRFVFMHNK